jgi:hypothetical protein
VTVEYLADRREFIPTVARWHHTEWGDLRPGETVEDRAVRVERDCGHREIPTTFVALAGHQCLGSASLVACDMDIPPALTPWLSGVFVAPEHRRARGRRGSRRASCAGGAGTRQATSLSFTRPVLALCISDLAGALQNAHFIASYGVPGLRALSVKTSRNLPRLRPANRFRHGDVLSDFLGSFRGDVFRLYHFRAASDH